MDLFFPAWTYSTLSDVSLVDREENFKCLKQFSQCGKGGSECSSREQFLKSARSIA